MLAKASGEAKAVGIAAEVESPAVLGDLVSRADAQVRALAANIDDEEALPEELRGVEAPAAPAAEPEEESEEQAAEDEEAAETDDDGDDDEDAGGEGLGAMFG